MLVWGEHLVFGGQRESLERYGKGKGGTWVGVATEKNKKRESLACGKIKEEEKKHIVLILHK